MSDYEKTAKALAPTPNPHAKRASPSVDDIDVFLEFLWSDPEELPRCMSRVVALRGAVSSIQEGLCYVLDGNLGVDGDALLEEHDLAEEYDDLITDLVGYQFMVVDDLKAVIAKYQAFTTNLLMARAELQHAKREREQREAEDNKDAVTLTD